MSDVAVRCTPRTPDIAPILFVFGHQKAGTSVVARSAAEALTLSAAIDFPLERLRPRLPSAYRGGTGIGDVLNRNRPHTEAAVVKEPSLTPLAPDLLTAFPFARFIVVSRRPQDTVESILHRFRVTHSSDSVRIPFGWRAIVECRGLPVPEEVVESGLIARLAWRIGYFDGIGDVVLNRHPSRGVGFDYESLAEGVEPLVEALATIGLRGDEGRVDLEPSAQPGRRDAADSSPMLEAAAAGELLNHHALGRSAGRARLDLADSATDDEQSANRETAE